MLLLSLALAPENLGLDRSLGQRLWGSSGHRNCIQELEVESEMSLLGQGLPSNVETKSGSGATENGRAARFLLRPWSSWEVPGQWVHPRLRGWFCCGPRFIRGCSKRAPSAPGCGFNMAWGRVSLLPPCGFPPVTLQKNPEQGKGVNQSNLYFLQNGAAGVRMTAPAPRSGCACHTLEVPTLR